MHIFTISLVLIGFSGCVASKNVPITIAAPIVPAPAAVIEPQTTAQLPAPQSVPPESIPARAPVEYHAHMAAPEPSLSAAPQPLGLHSKSKRTPASALQPQAAATVPPAAEEHTVPPQTLRAEEDKSLSKQNITDVLENVRKLLKSISEKPTNTGQKLSIDRIESLARLSEQAIARDDLRQADTLGRRALTLARDLKQSR